MKALHTVAFILVIVGGVNWLLVGLLDKDLFTLLGLGMGGMIAKTVYVLVGLSAIYLVATHKSSCKDCMASSSGM
jgi:uncharacterized membrane protein YuzA (DUF378 family)